MEYGSWGNDRVAGETAPRSSHTVMESVDSCSTFRAASNLKQVCFVIPHALHVQRRSVSVSAHTHIHHLCLKLYRHCCIDIVLTHHAPAWNRNIGIENTGSEASDEEEEGSVSQLCSWVRTESEKPIPSGSRQQYTNHQALAYSWSREGRLSGSTGGIRK